MVKPTAFHVTHWKAGSQWVRAVLEESAADRIVSSREVANWFAAPAPPGSIFTPVYATAEQFRQIVPAAENQRVFVVIRDPRDTLVSWYFSLLHSHTTADPTVKESRKILQRLGKTDGLALMICNHLCDAINIQRSWLKTQHKMFRYEELLTDQQAGFERILEICGIDLPPRRRRAIVRRHGFARKTWWRLGRENVRSHLRKGRAGDWRNHFCPRLTRLFKLHHNQDLLAAGYEQRPDWEA